MPISLLPEDAKEKFSVFELIGFIILVTGTLIYNEVVILPFLGLNLYTKKALEEKNVENIEINNETDV